jgi:hypothetical protein
VEAHFESVAAFQNPTLATWLRRVEHASEQPIEGHLPPQTLEINAVTTRLFV